LLLLGGAAGFCLLAVPAGWCTPRPAPLTYPPPTHPPSPHQNQQRKGHMRLWFWLIKGLGSRDFEPELVTVRTGSVDD